MQPKILKMELITSRAIGEALGTNKPNYNNLNNFLLKKFGFSEINQLYNAHFEEAGLIFIEKILKDLNLTIKISDDDLKKIPKSEAFITVSNHPFGAIDGLILIYLISKKRNDFKVMGNFLLKKITPISDYIIPVNPFKKSKTRLKNNIDGIRKSITHLESGHPIGIFPAGEVSTFQNGGNIADKMWSHSIIKFIRKSDAPILPIYFHGSNSISFHLLGLINPNLRTAKLPTELLNKKNKTITIRIGNIIDVNEQKLFSTTKDYGRFLRAKTYSLGTKLDVNKFFKYNQSKLKFQRKIIEKINKILLLKDIFSLDDNAKLFSWNNYEIYFASTRQIPNLINEIGRVREISFRQVKEGTGKPLDIDSYDLYYDQLFIWDSENYKLVGGYRVGCGDKIISKYGKKGVYINSLFKFNNKLNNILNQSIELGRSFVAFEYQKKAFSLFCLWKGILKVLISKPEYRYIIGPVTISNEYSNLSKNLIIEFIENYHFDHTISALVKPRKKYKIKYNSNDYELFVKSSTSLGLLDKTIEDIELGKNKVPILYKKYIQQNAKIIGFNRDPKFNNAIDGLMILDVSNIPVKTLKNLSNSDEDYTIISHRFHGQYHKTLYKIPQF